MLPDVPSVLPFTQTRVLPSGRSIVVRVQDGEESLEIHSADGNREVEVVLTDAGPVVRLSGARLELESPDAVALRCRRFDVHTTEGTALKSDGGVEIAGREMRVRTQGDIHLDGDYIRLNCDATP